MVVREARITMIKARIIGRIERFRSKAVVMQAIMVMMGTEAGYYSRPRTMMATTYP